MDKQKFVSLVIGKPWVNRAYSFEEMDCFGLIYLYYKHVLNKELFLPPCYHDGTELHLCWDDFLSEESWDEVDKPEEDGIVFTSYKDGIPIHVGIVLNRNQVLHCAGNIKNPGKVSIQSLRAIKRYYGHVTFHKRISTDEIS